MRAFLIDSENVNFDNFIKTNKFKKKDHFYIVGNATLKFSLFALKFLQGRKVKFYDFNEPSKDYADKIILTLLGFLSAKKKFKKCLIVSNDNIFAKHDFTRNFFGGAVKVIKINNEQNPKITLKSDYHILLYEKNEAFIRTLHAQSKNLGEFHCALQKHYKIHGTLIYKFLKENRKDEYFGPLKHRQIKDEHFDPLKQRQIKDGHFSPFKHRQITQNSPKLLTLKNENLNENAENLDENDKNSRNLDENLNDENSLVKNENSAENFALSSENLAINSNKNPTKNTKKKSFLGKIFDI